MLDNYLKKHWVIISLFICVVVIIYLAWGIINIIDGINYNNQVAANNYIAVESNMFDNYVTLASEEVQEADKREKLRNEIDRLNDINFENISRINGVDIAFLLREDKKSLEIYELVSEISRMTRNMKIGARDPGFIHLDFNEENYIELDDNEKQFLIDFTEKLNQMKNYFQESDLRVTVGETYLELGEDKLSKSEKEKILQEGNDLINLYENFKENHQAN